jgi:hypothetical protein
VKSPGSAATDADAGREATVVARLLHRRRGWIWATVITIVAWLAAVLLLGGLDPDGTGAGSVVGTTFVLLLSVAVVVALVASVADTVRLRRRDASARERAREEIAFYPARSHAYSYPPRHLFTWVYGWVMLLVLLVLGAPALPALVNGIAYLAGTGSSTTFLPVSYGQQCGRNGCSPVTTGVLANGSSINWPGKVPLGHAFKVRERLWNWGLGSGVISGGTATTDIVFGVIFDGLAVLILVHLARLVSRWLRYRWADR